MNSLEALIQLKLLNRIGVVNRKGEIIKDTLPHEELYDIIKRDLEVLEIIKANKNIIFSKKPNYEDMSADDYFKLKEWLEK